MFATAGLVLAVQVLAGRVAAAVGGGAATLGVVVPVGAVAVGVDLAVDVDVVVAVDVDVHAAAAPVDAAPQRVADTDADAPGDAGGDGAREPVAGRWREEEGRVGRVGPGAEHVHRVVGRHKDHAGLRRLDHDHLRRRRGLLHHHGRGRRRGWLRRHRDLFVALEVAGLLGALAQALHRVHHVLGLRQEGVTHVAHPFGLRAKRDQHIGEGHQRGHRRIPGLVFHQLDGRVALFIGVRLGPRRSRREILGVGRGHEQLGQQGVGEQGDGRRHLFELLVAERFGRLRLALQRQQQGQPQGRPREPGNNAFDHLNLLNIDLGATVRGPERHRRQRPEWHHSRALKRSRIATCHGRAMLLPARLTLSPTL